jgi:hypothetical protein
MKASLEPSARGDNRLFATRLIGVLDVVAGQIDVLKAEHLALQRSAASVHNGRSGQASQTIRRSAPTKA